MKDNRKSEIRVGITVLIGFVLITWIFLWAKNASIFNDDKVVKVEFNSVAGLEKGDAVTISGLKKGYVSEIELVKNKIIVSIMLGKEIELRQDAQFFIQMADLMGTKKIDIIPGVDEVKLDISQISKGYFSGDIATAMAMLSSVQGDLVAVIKDFRFTLDKVNDLFADEELKNEIKNSLKNVNNLSQDLTVMIRENRKAVSDLLNEGRALTKSGSEFLKDNSERVKSFLIGSEEVFKNLNSLLVKSGDLVDETASGKNNFGKILKDENLFNDIKTSLKELRELLKLFNEQLKGEGLKVDADIF